MTSTSEAMYKAVVLELQEAQTEVDLRGVLLQKSGKLLKNAVEELALTIAQIAALEVKLNLSNALIRSAFIEGVGCGWETSNGVQVSVAHLWEDSAMFKQLHKSDDAEGSGMVGSG